MRRFQAEKIPKPRTGPVFRLEDLPSGMGLDIEVGCGVGYRPIRYARENPDRFLIAIEHTRTKFEKFERRLAHHEKLPNLLAVHADAIGWISHSLPDSSVDRYFFFYPNPDHRWYRLPFMEKVLATLKPGGSLTIATNLKDYAADACRQMTGEWGMSLLSRAEIRGPSLEAGYPRTHFEKKYLERGKTCFDLVFSRGPRTSTSAGPREVPEAAVSP